MKVKTIPIIDDEQDLAELIEVNLLHEGNRPQQPMQV